MVNNSLAKKVVLISSFVVNVLILLLTAFLSCFWIYITTAFLFVFVFAFVISFNNYIHDKLKLLICISILPIWGMIYYLLGKHNNRYLKSRSIYQNLKFRNSDETIINNDLLKNIKKQNPKHYKTFKYFTESLKAPLSNNSSTTFLSSGNEITEELYTELKNAKKYILIQQYVMKEGVVWDTIFNILKEKAREGVEIKILYNAHGCKNAFTDKLTFKKLANYKIDCLPYRNGVFGFHSHKKLVIIDGLIGFYGNFNISDNYSQFENENDNWEICAVKARGDAVWQGAIDFFNDWQYSKGKLTGDFINYKPGISLKLKSNEIVQPLSINPLSNHDECKNTLLSLINNASENITILSSFINVDKDVVAALKKAIKSGVEVNIITSSISDKEINFALSREQYFELIRVNANIYEYSYSFMRARMIIIDNEMLLIGSVPFDTRWLHLQHENAILTDGKETLKIATKYVENVKYKSKLVILKDFKERPFKQKVTAWIFKFFRISF